MPIRCKRIFFSLTGLLLSCLARETWATDVNVVGLFADRAIVAINSGPPRMLRVGQAPVEGVKLLHADSQSAILEFDGTRHTLALGQAFAAQTGAAGDTPRVVILADAQGQFFASGNVNQAPARFMVDTGATDVVLSSAQARQMGIHYLGGERILNYTANGVAAAYKVVLDTVKVGEISLHEVEGLVSEGPGSPVPLLGMSFLRRVEMRREGSTLTLTKRY